MDMPVLNNDELLAAAGAATQEGRRPTMVAKRGWRPPRLRTIEASTSAQIQRRGISCVFCARLTRRRMFPVVLAQSCVARVFTRRLFRTGADSVTPAPSRR